MPNRQSPIADLKSQLMSERELGAGGMATVYLAEDLKHDRNVAVNMSITYAATCCRT
jgi:serine/threonine-protein kinase